MAFSLLLVAATTVILILALLRIFYPELYAKHVLRIPDRRGIVEWSNSSSKAGSIAALIFLALMLLGALMRHR